MVITNLVTNMVYTSYIIKDVIINKIYTINSTTTKVEPKGIVDMA